MKNDENMNYIIGEYKIKKKDVNKDIHIYN